MMLGYTNLGAGAEEIDQEVARLRAVGCDQIVVDSEYGPDRTRRVFKGLVSSLGSGDAIAVYDLDRIGASLDEVLALLLVIFRKGVGLRVLADGFAVDEGGARETIALVEALLRVSHRPVVRSRAADRAIRAANGRRTGRPRVLLPQDADRVEAMLRESGANVAATAKELGVSAATLYRFLRERHKERMDEPVA